MQTARDMTAPLAGRPMLHALAKCWWLLLLRGIAAVVVVGLLGIAAGIVTFAWPGITAIMLVLFIGAWAVVHGIFEIIGAIQLRREIDNEWMLILGGALSVLFGLIVLIAPGAGALGLIWAIGSYSIVFGILFIALALRLRKHSHPAGSPGAA
jgi:uncharacterized membrane protein HdeD (DUF308 family)